MTHPLYFKSNSKAPLYQTVKYLLYWGLVNTLYSFNPKLGDKAYEILFCGGSSDLRERILAGRKAYEAGLRRDEELAKSRSHIKDEYERLEKLI